MPNRTPGVVGLDCLGDVLNVAAKQATDVPIDAGARHLRSSEHYRKCRWRGSTAYTGGIDCPGIRLIRRRSCRRRVCGRRGSDCFGGAPREASEQTADLRLMRPRST